MSTKCMVTIGILSIIMNSALSSPQPQNAKVCHDLSDTCVCKPGYFGPQCESRCNVRSTPKLPKNTYACDTISSACLCHPGWYGCHCNYTCPEPFYGSGCELLNTCKLENIISYNKTNGNCNCAPGWRGSRCENPCTDWKYGVDRSQNCSCDERNTKFCNKSSGECICKDGWKGRKCTWCSGLKYGKNCNETCKCQQNSTRKCTKKKGKCICKDGWEGETCNITKLDNTMPTEDQKLCGKGNGNKCLYKSNNIPIFEDERNTKFCNQSSGNKCLDKSDYDAESTPQRKSFVLMLSIAAAVLVLLCLLLYIRVKKQSPNTRNRIQAGTLSGNTTIPEEVQYVNVDEGKLSGDIPRDSFTDYSSEDEINTRDQTSALNDKNDYSYSNAEDSALKIHCIPIKDKVMLCVV